MRLSALTVLVLLAACGGSGGAATQQPPFNPIIAEVRADLSVYVSSTLSYVQRSSEGYVVPTAAELTAFDALATKSRRARSPEPSTRHFRMRHRRPRIRMEGFV